MEDPVKWVYSDNADDYIKPCRYWRYPHEKSHHGVPETNDVIKRKVQRVLDGMRKLPRILVVVRCEMLRSFSQLMRAIQGFPKRLGGEAWTPSPPWNKLIPSGARVFSEKAITKY